MRALVLLFAAVTVLASCDGEPPADLGGSQLIVEMRDYRVDLSTPSVKAGTVKIGVRNRGGTPHDLIVLRTDRAPDALPVQDARAVEEGRIGATPQIRAGRAAALTLDLAPGRYVLICNVPGHYTLGMRALLVVE